MNILVIDDHPVLREGVATLLQHGLSDTVVIQADSVSTAVGIIADRADLDLVVLDYLMPKVGGPDAIVELGKARLDLPVIVYSSSEDPNDVREALAAGALGYVPKSASPKVLLAAIQVVLDGETYVPSLILKPTPTPVESKTGGTTDKDNLTLRQIDVLHLLSEGHPNKVIATKLGLSEKTVKAHVTAVFKALNVVNRTQAVTVAKAVGLI